MRSALLFFILFLASVPNCFAQVATHKVSGIVYSQGNIPLRDATIKVFDQKDSLIILTKTDSQGHFVFDHSKGGQLEISFTGFTTYRAAVVNEQTLVISLVPKVHNLDSVTVRSQRPFVEQQFDRTLVNVDGNPKLGINAADMLKKVPGVSIINESQIMLEGKTVTVYIDGKPTRLSGDNLMNLLSGLPTAGISQVEVIHSPGARYDAQTDGAIINIKTLKRSKPGYDGTISITAGHGWKYFLDNDISATLNYRRGNDYLYGSYDYGSGKQSQEIQKNTYLDAIGQRLEDSLFYHTPYHSQNARFGWDHTINKKEQAGILITAYNSYSGSGLDTKTNIYNLTGTLADSGWYSQDISSRKSKGINVNLNYKKLIDSARKQELTTDADAGIFLYDNDNSFSSIAIDQGNNRVLPWQYVSQAGHTSTGIFSYKMDYTQKWFKGNLDAGMKGSYVNIDNRFLSNGTTDNYIYRETLLAAYLSSKQVIGKFTLQLGLRAEQTFTDGNSVAIGNDVKRSYLDFFPNFSSGYKTKQGLLTFSFSQRIGRPNYSYLNPFRIIRSTYAQSVGNPYLQPSFTNSYRISYNLKNKYSLTLYYSTVSNVITDLYVVDDASKITTSMKANLNNNTNTGLSLGYNDKLFGFLSVNYSAGTAYNVYRFDYMSSGQAVKQLTGSLYLDHYFSLPEEWWLDVYFYGQTSVTYGNQVNLPMSLTSLGGGKKIFGGKGNVSVNISDIFFTGVQRSAADYGNVRTDSKSRYDSRRFKLSLSYNFGNSKLAARQRSAGSVDEQRRSL